MSARDYALLESHPRTHLAVPGAVCGGGLPQPSWGVCEEPGTWRIDRYQHAYCVTHSAMRIRANELLIKGKV